jgi:hypothetical protein
MYYTIETSYTFGQAKHEIVKHESKQARVGYLKANPQAKKIGFVDAVKFLSK